METVTISRRSAEALLARMIDWCEYVEDISADTRADIIALDELVNVLDAEHIIEAKHAEEMQRRQRMWEEQKAAKAAQND